jgi:hypothetical protein
MAFGSATDERRTCREWENESARTVTITFRTQTVPNKAMNRKKNADSEPRVSIAMNIMYIQFS